MFKFLLMIFPLTQPLPQGRGEIKKYIITKSPSSLRESKDKKKRNVIQYFIIIIACCLFAFATSAHSKNFELTLTGNLESDPVSKEKELLVKFKQKAKDKKFLNKMSLKIDHGYRVNGGIATKNKELFDYEQNLQFFHKEKKSFIAVYFRYKDDNFSNSVIQNYSIFSTGYGIQKRNRQRKNYF